MTSNLTAGRSSRYVSRRRLSPSIVALVEKIASEALARRPDVLTGSAASKPASLRAAQAEFLPEIFVAANGTLLSGSLDVTAIPGVDQQLPIVNLPGNQLGVSQRQLAGTALVGATVPPYDGG
jgi:outer membrane protein